MVSDALSVLLNFVCVHVCVRVCVYILEREGSHMSGERGRGREGES